MKKQFLLAVLLFPFCSNSQSITADIRVKFELSSKPTLLYIFIYTDQEIKVDSIPFPANNEWTFKGDLSSASEINIGTSDNFILGFWVDETPVSLTCKSQLSDRKSKSLQITDFRGSRDGQLYNLIPTFPYILRPNRTQRLLNPIPADSLKSYIQKLEIESKKFAEEKGIKLIDSLILTHPGSPILPFIIRRLSFEIGPEIAAAYYDQFSDKVKSTREARSLKQDLDRLSLFKQGVALENFIIPNNEGKSFQLHAIKAKYILLEFWSSRCGPCRAKHPYLKDVYNKYRDMGLEIIGISLDDNKNDWLTAIEKDNLPWIQASDLMGRKGDLVKKYKIGPIPFIVLLNEKYEVIANNLETLQIDMMLSTLMK